MLADDTRFWPVVPDEVETMVEERQKMLEELKAKAKGGKAGGQQEPEQPE